MNRAERRAAARTRVKQPVVKSVRNPLALLMPMPEKTRMSVLLEFSQAVNLASAGAEKWPLARDALADLRCIVEALVERGNLHLSEVGALLASTGAAIMHADQHGGVLPPEGLQALGELYDVYALAVEQLPEVEIRHAQARAIQVIESRRLAGDVAGMDVEVQSPSA